MKTRTRFYYLIKNKILFSEYEKAAESQKLIIRDKIFELNKKLANTAIRRYFGGSLSADEYREYLNCGYIGVLKAIDPYVRNKFRSKFSTYAFWHIFKEFDINQHNNEKVYIPFSKWRLRKKINRSLTEDVLFSDWEEKITKTMTSEDKKSLNLAYKNIENYNDLIKHKTNNKKFDNINMTADVHNALQNTVKDDVRKQENIKLLLYQIENNLTFQELIDELSLGITASAVSLRFKRLIGSLRKNKTLKKLWEEDT